jgi:hypothetical protein
MTETWTDKRVVIREGWYEAGKQGTALGEPVFVLQDWVPVKWDDDEDPDFNKKAGLTFAPEPVEPVDPWDVLHAINMQATRMERATSEHKYLVYDLEQIARLSENALATYITTEEHLK